ncbi:hypothetical protein RB601_003444 [Gaeumannomyces tritici]
MSAPPNTTLGAGGGRAYRRCDEVSAFCPVQLTTLGYYPNRGANYFFAIGFGLCIIVALVLGTWKKTWSYMAFLTAGCALELAGYGARVALADNPWNKHAFETQICAIVLGPTLICISIYLTLKHVTLALGPSLSRVPPRVYPLIFVPADVSCLLVQAVGGALAASASAGDGVPNLDLVNAGNRAIIAGICLQVVVLAAFGIMSADFYLRVRRRVASGQADAEAAALWRDGKFRAFAGAVAVAYAAVFARCVYRIAEMAGGWGNHIMQDEASFIVLDSVMMLVASALLAAFAPGLLFPQMAEAMNARRDEEAKAKEGAAAAAAADSEVNTGNESQDTEKSAPPTSQGEAKVTP